MDIRDGRIYSDDQVQQMGIRDGRIYSDDPVQQMATQDTPFLRKMENYPTPLQRASGKVGRNDYCLCGSGKKFKKCCAVREDKK